MCICRYDPLSWEYPTWASINGPAVNILKGALVTSDRIVTVSEVRLWLPSSPGLVYPHGTKCYVLVRMTLSTMQCICCSVQHCTSD